jgi:hypothetical protein
MTGEGAIPSRPTMSTNTSNGQTLAATSPLVDVIPTIDTVDYHKDYFFTNLDAFGVDPGNRPSEESDVTVKKYAKLMQKGEWFFDLSPIYVGIKSHNIFNGEHRRKAINLAMEKGLKPRICVRFFDDTDDKSLDKKRDALNSGRHWNSDDFVKALISEGDKNFIFLDKFCKDEDHPQLHTKKGLPCYNKGAIVLGSTYRGFKEAYLGGSWDVTPDDLATAEKRYGEMVRIKKAIGYDDAGQDCWIYIGEAWYQFSTSKNYMDRVKSLPKGIETFYDALRFVDNTNSNKTRVWFGRFVEALEKAERHS